MTTNRGKRALDMVMGSEWLITEPALLSIIDIATRDKIDIDALQTRLGKQLENSRTVSTRGNIAVVPFIGPVFRYSNLFTDISGATSLSIFAKDFQAAEDDESIDTIIIEMDSPGGQASGISEQAQIIRSSSKKVIAYASNLAASAGYWIASAADEVIISDTAQLGSIGVISTFYDDEDPKEIRIISSQSPNKRPDIKTDQGRAEVQKVVDSLANVFVNAVADYRGVSSDIVLEKFGKGGVLVGEQAVKAGMADRVDTLENLIAGLSGKTRRGKLNMTDKAQSKPEVLTLDKLKSDYKDIYQAAYQEGAQAGSTAERDRIKAVESLSMPGHETLIEQMKYDGKTSAEMAAVQILKAEKSNRETALNQLREEAPEALEPISEESSTKNISSMTLDEKIKHAWETKAEIREEFGDFESYESFEKAASCGQARLLSK